MKSEKAIVKAFSIKPEQLEKVMELIDATRYGQFSQFIQDAIDEKLLKEHLFRNSQNKQNKIAS